jgi:hypothetical protein
MEADVRGKEGIKNGLEKHREMSYIICAIGVADFHIHTILKKPGVPAPGFRFFSS